MITLETFTLYVILCVLAPLTGAFTVLFLFGFEKRIDVLQHEASQLRLEKQLQQSQYDTLSQQIQPHFFFNTLNVILSLARLNRKKELIQSIETLSLFFKHKYSNAESTSTIEKELAYTNYYLDIQKLRYRDRLTIEQHIETGSYSYAIPSFVLQTLVENCFKHSFDRNQGNLHLIISIKKIDASMHLHVKNNRSKENETSFEYNSKSSGLGLKNIKKRLKLLYPNERTNLKMVNKEDWTIVQIEWPAQIFLRGGSQNEHSSR